MAKYVVDDSSLTAVATEIRSYGNIDDLIVFPDGFVDGVLAVHIIGHEMGYGDGFVDGELAGIEQGKQSEYDRFWDAYQDSGNRTHYAYAFAHSGWNAETFKPKYDIRPTSFESAFFHFCRTDTSFNGPVTQVDMVKLEQELGFVLDVSKATNLSSSFATCGFSRLNVVDLAACKKNLGYVFYGGYSTANLLKRIERLVCYEGNVFAESSFQACGGIEYIGFEGTIAANGLNLQWSTLLNKSSIEGLVSTLSTTTSGLSVTLSLKAVNTAFETSEGAADGSTSEEWTTLVNTRSNWTINLV